MADDRLEIDRQHKKIMSRHKDARDQLIATNEEVLEKLSGFFQYIASLSSGAIVVSISFLGQLQDTVKETSVFSVRNIIFTNYYFLYSAWVFLLIAVMSSLYRNFFHTHYMHWATQATWHTTSKISEEFALEQLEGNLIYNATEETRDIITSNISNWEKALKTSSRAKKVKEILYRTFQSIAQVSFVLGLASLIAFGIITLMNKP